MKMMKQLYIPAGEDKVSYEYHVKSIKKEYEKKDLRNDYAIDGLYLCQTQARNFRWRDGIFTRYT